MMKRILRFSYLTFFLLGLLFLITGSASARSGDVVVLSVRGNIVPIVADYIDRGIAQAEERGSAACIIQLDTPGGLLNSTEVIVTRIMNAKVPVVVYVSPHGAWAASAGTFITLSAHITAMAPATSIGAAHPVGPGGETLGETELQKATEFTSAWIQSIAEKRGRDPSLLEAAVRESRSFTDTEAVQLKLVDFVADDLNSVIRQINGRTVTLADGRQVTIETEGASATHDEMSGIEQFLLMISNPNVAYLLLTLASIGLITEISNPGLIFPGVIGGISLFFAFYALGVLNAYWAGLLLMFLAFGLFITEIFVPAYGILTTGGIISLVFGSLILFSGSDVSMEFDKGLVAVVSIIMAIFVGLIVWAVVRGQRRRIETGREGMIGQVAEVKTTLGPKGMVMVEGELWTAEIDEGTAEPGEQVKIQRMDNLKLYVTKNK
jgi:membrane-bound serine protease (ClpP class)